MSVTCKRVVKAKPDLDKKIAALLADRITKVAAKADTEATLLLSGGIPEAAFIAAHHPLSRLRLNPAWPRLPINIQSGELIASMQIIPTVEPTQASVRLFFTSPHAVVLSQGGTDRMVERGFWAQLKARVAPTFARAGRAFTQTTRLLRS